MSISSYLRTCQNTLGLFTSRSLAHNLTFVIGNESADLDSCVSSITYGYLQTIKGGTGCTVIPVLNLPRADIPLRVELKLLLKSVNISESDLICRDELPTGVKDSKPSFVLVDHNHFKVEGFRAEDVQVTGVIDHHVDEGLYLDASPRVVEGCGSCTSLVVDHFANLWKKDQIEGETQLTKLALSTILVDTSKLSEQATEIDFNVVKFLRSRLMTTQNWDEDSQYKALRDAKRDNRGLSFAQLLRRDYKEWDLGTLGMWGVSSITTSLDNLLNMQDWQAGLKSQGASRNLTVHMLMTKHGDKELFIHQIDDSKAKYVKQFIDLATTEILLKPWKSSGEYQAPPFYAYQQGDVSATRKKVAILCQTIAKRAGNTNVSTTEGGN